MTWVSASVCASIRRQERQFPQASPSAVGFAQFRAEAKARAVDVLPVCLGPVNKYAWATEDRWIDESRARIAVCCPWMSASLTLEPLKPFHIHDEHHSAADKHLDRTWDENANGSSVPRDEVCVLLPGLAALLYHA